MPGDRLWRGKRSGWPPRMRRGVRLEETRAGKDHEPREDVDREQNGVRDVEQHAQHVGRHLG